VCRRSLARLFSATSCLTGLVIPPDCFMRVSFGNESGDRLFSSRDEPIDVFYQRMETVLKQGGCHYDHRPCGGARVAVC
jgi:hypothetical protein